MAVIVSVGEIRKFYNENRFALQSEYRLVADEAEVGAEVYITEEEGLPYFTVEVDGVVEYEAKASSEAESKRFTRSSSISTSAKPIAMRFWMQKT